MEEELNYLSERIEELDSGLIFCKLTNKDLDVCEIPYTKLEIQLLNNILSYITTKELEQ